MARVRYLDTEDLKPEYRYLLDRPISLNRALANSCGGAEVFSGVGNWIRFSSKLNPRLRELAILQVGWSAQSSYEWSHHIKIGEDFGVTKGDITNLIADSAGKKTDLPRLDRLVLLAAREATVGGAISEDVVKELRFHLNDELLVELVLVISFYCGVVRILDSLDIDIEPAFVRYIEAFPLKTESREK